MKYHQLNTLFYVSLQLIVKQCLNPLIRVKRACVFLLEFKKWGASKLTGLSQCLDTIPISLMVNVSVSCF